MDTTRGVVANGVALVVAPSSLVDTRAASTRTTCSARNGVPVALMSVSRPLPGRQWLGLRVAGQAHALDPIGRDALAGGGRDDSAGLQVA